ncbi:MULTISPECIES: CidA/LrgA family protein [unclassified Paracoccus (in: a-proteobacteria)]|uniref:CidA/LrgA family protein n=1 Tax=unclassified Paracoccus (in: a-proteobacteria) TaxID=2688777 RepID=UPI0015FFBEF4|nr:MULTISPECIES: CidA/LrgA family protein [unclassified Paracoccus (in: a-proteobacteria)]MBB1491655.1 CidA/LrgA family protein [Paracoccus sp. MC1854]MBB1498331.1 CidA/LrgA family protein [Paracoccus sp. MC1862]QQO44913.1 CidA/LrgA family protein [Paracoccus sp. MC1862]
MVPALVTILCFQLVGEVISRGLDLPLPGPVVGLVLLLGAMRLRPGLAGWLRPVGEGVLAHLSLFFVPAGVGIVAHLPLLREHGLALLVAIVVSTVLALVAGSGAFIFVARLTGQEER